MCANIAWTNVHAKNHTKTTQTKKTQFFEGVGLQFALALKNFLFVVVVDVVDVDGHCHLHLHLLLFLLLLLLLFLFLFLFFFFLGLAPRNTEICTCVQILNNKQTKQTKKNTILK